MTALVPDAVDRIRHTWVQVRHKGYGGMIGLDADLNTGKIIGRAFPPGLTATTLGGYYARGGARRQETDLPDRYHAITSAVSGIRW